MFELSCGYLAAVRVSRTAVDDGRARWRISDCTPSPSGTQHLGHSPGFAIIVSVTDASGAPVGGLQSANFDPLVFDDPDHPVRPLGPVVREIPSPPGGVYVLSNVGQAPWIGPMLTVVLTVTSGADSGRVTVSSGP